MAELQPLVVSDAAWSAHGQTVGTAGHVAIGTYPAARAYMSI